MNSQSTQDAKTILELEAESTRVQLLCEVEEGGTKLFLTASLLQDSDAPIPTFSELRQLLLEHVFEDFLHEEVLKDIAERLARGEEISRRRIAKGKESEQGIDGKLLLLVKPMTLMAGSGEYVSPHHIKYFDNLEPGVIVARIYPPKSGRDGLDVFGKPIKASAGVPVEVEIGEGLEKRSTDSGFETLSATTYGYLEDNSKGIRVVETLSLRSDVDYRTGDVEFVGSVEIRGNVAKGFRVFAREDILIEGDVRGGVICSEFGSVRITGTVTGVLDVASSSAATANSLRTLSLAAKEMRSDQITAEKSVTIALVENATVSAKEDVLIEKEANHSRLRSRASLLLPKGHLRSGFAYAVCGLEAQSVGTVSDSETLSIELCSDIESSSEYLAVQDKIALHTEALSMVLRLLGPFAEDRAAIQRLQESHRSRLFDLLEKRKKLEGSIAALEIEKAELLETACYNSVMRVNFHKSLYPGVRISTAGEVYVSEETIAGPKTLEFVVDEKVYKLTELKPLLCEV